MSVRNAWGGAEAARMLVTALGCANAALASRVRLAATEHIHHLPTPRRGDGHTANGAVEIAGLA